MGHTRPEETRFPGEDEGLPGKRAGGQAECEDRLTRRSRTKAPPGQVVASAGPARRWKDVSEVTRPWTDAGAEKVGAAVLGVNWKASESALSGVSPTCFYPQRQPGDTALGPKMLLSPAKEEPVTEQTGRDGPRGGAAAPDSCPRFTPLARRLLP